jgi:hypothetical protein
MPSFPFSYTNNAYKLNFTKLNGRVFIKTITACTLAGCELSFSVYEVDLI